MKGFVSNAPELHHSAVGDEWRRPKSPSDGDGATVELAQAKASEWFVVQQLVIAQKSNGDLFAEIHSLITIGAPMHARSIAAKRDVGGQLIEFTTDGQHSSMGNERQAVSRGLNGRVDDEAFLEESF